MATSCSSDDSDSTTPASTTTILGDGPDDADAEVEPAMQVTFDLNPEAVWDDGTPISHEDFACTVAATVNTPGAVNSLGHDLITSVASGSSPNQVVVEFSEPFAPYKTLFSPLVPAHAVDNCSDVSQNWQSEVPPSAGPWTLVSFTESEIQLVPNDNYWGENQPIADSVRIVDHSGDPVSALVNGTADFTFLQQGPGVVERLARPGIETSVVSGVSFESLMFQQGSERGGPLADPAFRTAFAMSIDRQLLLKNVYRPISDDFELMGCGPWLESRSWCAENRYEEFFDPGGAADLLESEGWIRNNEGFWERDGEVPVVRWMITVPNERREIAQQVLIPDLANYGFKVEPDNDDAATVFQTRAPQGDFDLFMVVIDLNPDPGRSEMFSCDQIPSAESNFQGRNIMFWCNEETTTRLRQSDQALDPGQRAELLGMVADDLVADAVFAPLVYFPHIAAWRTDGLVNNPRADAFSGQRQFADALPFWDPGEDGEITIAAEQYPRCINPIIECNNNTWMATSVIYPTMPTPWFATAAGEYVHSSLLAGEPVLEMLE